MGEVSEERGTGALLCIMETPGPHDERRIDLTHRLTLPRHWFRLQRELFPWLEEALGSLGQRYEPLVRVLEQLVQVEQLPHSSSGWWGLPLKDEPRPVDSAFSY